MQTTINTKFQIGETVYFLRDNAVKVGTIQSIFATLSFSEEENVTFVEYRVLTGYQNSMTRKFEENELFSSQQELYDSLSRLFRKDEDAQKFLLLRTKKPANNHSQ
jgi:hypothetical protein